MRLPQKFKLLLAALCLFSSPAFAVNGRACGGPGGAFGEPMEPLEQVKRQLVCQKKTGTYEKRLGSLGE